MEIINQKEYLKRYLSGDKHKKKKRKKHPIVGNRVKIIDDDIDISQLTVQEAVDALGANEDAPQIVGVIDERPMHLRIDDYRKSDLWKPVGGQVNSTHDDQVNFNLSVKNLNKSKHNKPEKYEDDNSPPRRSRRDSCSPIQQTNIRDSGTPPPRKNHNVSSASIDSKDMSPPRQKQRDADNSPPRRNKKDSDSSPSRYRIEDRDMSPPRRKHKNIESSPPRKRKYLDTSPARKRIKEKVNPHHQRQSDNRLFKEEIADGKGSKSKRPLLPGNKKGKYVIPAKRDLKQQPMTKTLEGKAAGLQSAQELVKENEAFRKSEDELFKNLSSDVSGVNATVVIRDRKTGKIRDFQKEAEEKLEKEKEEEKNKEKYSRWGRGLKQVEDYENKLVGDLHEMSKPLARYADDEELEQFLKEQEREGDPMLDYIRKKKRKHIIESKKPVKPQFEGEFMPNRFGIKPGHRWDGVDRSNGYEKKWIDAQNAKTVQQEETYKWSIEDM